MQQNSKCLIIQLNQKFKFTYNILKQVSSQAFIFFKYNDLVLTHRHAVKLKLEMIYVLGKTRYKTRKKSTYLDAITMNL